MLDILKNFPKKGLFAFLCLLIHNFKQNIKKVLLEKVLQMDGWMYGPTDRSKPIHWLGHIFI